MAPFRASGFVMAGSALMLVACMFDSRMLSEPQTQRTAAAKLTPKLDAEPSVEPRPVRAIRVRAYVTRQHAAEAPRWQDYLEERVAAANKVLASELGARLELESMRAWSLGEPGDSLEQPLAALGALDAGDDVDFVLGLVASEPKLSFSFHELGMTRLFGKHLVLRAANDRRELDAIEQSFSALSVAERQELYKARRAHKAAAILLHEIAHSLGAPHTRDPKSILSAHYSPEVAGFGAPARGFLGVAFRFRSQVPRDDRAMAKGLLEELDRSPDTWASAEREQLERQLSTFLTRSEPAAAEPPPASASPAGLEVADRGRFARAQSELSAGDVAAAWKSASPLFERYPDEYEVQDLRCKIAMRRGLPYEAVRSECKRLMELSPGMQKWQ